MEINTFDIAKQKLGRKGINIDDCEIMHESILKDNTSTDPVCLEDIEASNEYYFLISNLKDGTSITSDEDTIEVDDPLKESLVGKSLLVFTGTIRIKVPANTKQLIEFMRVRPLKTKQH